MESMPLIHEMIDYDVLLDALYAQNAFEADALYWAEKAAGEADAMPDCYCPVRAAAFSARANQLLDASAMNLKALKTAITIFNEHDEYPVALEREGDEWVLQVC